MPVSSAVVRVSESLAGISARCSPLVTAVRQRRVAVYRDRVAPGSAQGVVAFGEPAPVLGRLICADTPSNAGGRGPRQPQCRRQAAPTRPCCCGALSLVAGEDAARRSSLQGACFRASSSKLRLPRRHPALATRAFHRDRSDRRSHPFSTGLALPGSHGSLSITSPARERAPGIDSNSHDRVAPAYLTWRLREGVHSRRRSEGLPQDLDGFYTFAVGTVDGLPLCDPIACKPAVMARPTTGLHASEYRALARFRAARTQWEPSPRMCTSGSQASRRCDLMPHLRTGEPALRATQTLAAAEPPPRAQRR